MQHKCEGQSLPVNTAAAERHKDNNDATIGGGVAAVVMLDSSVKTPVWNIINLHLWFCALAPPGTAGLAQQSHGTGWRTRPLCSNNCRAF